jgi:aryl-alcohol dehydrogenase-like predicted oxidoreductase
LETRPLGNSDLRLTPLGLGTWALGGDSVHFGWGPQDDQDSMAAIRRALDLGINWVDTAPIYGFGHSEEIVGRALAGVSRKPYVFTKCSLVWDAQRVVGNRLKAGSIKRECEDSLRRLRVEAIDLYQIHWPNPEADLEEGWRALSELRQEGKVRWIGVSNFSVDQMRRLQPIAPLTSLQPPYSAIRRDIEREILPFCGKEGIGVIVYSPLQAGLLSGKMTRARVAELPEKDWRRNAKEFQEPNLTRNLGLQDRFRDVGADHGHTAAVAALAWVLSHKEVTGAIVGARRPEQVEGFIAAMDFKLSDDEVRAIDQFLEA